MAPNQDWKDPKLDFPTRIARIYDADGPMAQMLNDFRPRPGQQEFAREVAKAIEGKTTLIAEAGTGTGKTFAYLIPAIVAGVTTIVSTAGKSLQDQLFAKDLPAIRRALGVPVTVSLLKGRANYVCHFHLEVMASNDRLPQKDSFIKLRKIQRFAATSETGDRAELPDVPEDDPLWPMVTSTRENCLGRDRCPHWEECFVRRARERAMQSNVVIVNHHLYLSSLALKNSSRGAIDGLLPEATLTVIDEAHQLPDIALDFFGTGFSTNQLDSIGQEAAALGARATLNGAGALWNKFYTKMQNACRRIVLRINEMGFKEGDRISLDTMSNLSELLDPFIELENVCNEYKEQMKVNEGRDNEFDTLIAWFDELYEEVFDWGELIKKRVNPSESELEAPILERIKEQGEVVTPPSEKESANRVLWFTVGRSWVRFNNTPLSFAKDFRYMREQMGGAWVFTSATLSNNKNFTHFKAELGIDEAVEESWDSPFNYWEQGCLYIPKLPAPKNNTHEHTRNVIEATWPLINAAEGRTFVLCTSLVAVKDAAEMLEAKLEANNLPYKLLVQGSAPKPTLISEFRQHGNAILVGSTGFWEGVDVKGDALSLVIIDKIPFSPPDDPVEVARCEAIEKEGKHPFAVHTLPAAVLALKQGSGRLIRSENDRGMVVLCDSRVIDKGYGKIVLKNLPDFYRTRREDKALQFFLSPELFKEGLYS